MSETPVSLGLRKMSALDGRFSLVSANAAPIMFESPWVEWERHWNPGHGPCCDRMAGLAGDAVPRPHSARFESPWPDRPLRPRRTRACVFAAPDPNECHHHKIQGARHDRSHPASTPVPERTARMAGVACFTITAFDAGPRADTAAA